MATTSLAVTSKVGNQEQDERKQAIEPGADNPLEISGEDAAAAVGLTPPEQDALLEVRRLWKDGSLPKRNLLIRRILRAFEVLKNNPYILYNETTADYDSLAMILQGNASKEEVDLYQYQDNIYQMLALAFIAALSVDVSKTRYQPVDPLNEEDQRMAKKASTIHAFNERQNGIDGLQQLELLYLWCTGSYFCYTRHIIDRNRAGVTKQPVMAMQSVPVLPDRYICPQCGSTIPEDQLAGFGSLTCPDCGATLGEADWHESQSLMMPMKVGTKEVPNGMTAFNIYSGLNVDADPDAQELYESLYLDLEVESNVAAVRAAYPDEYDDFQDNDTGDGTTDGDQAKRARAMVTSPAGSSSLMGQNKGTYSRCWFQPEAFNILPDRVMAENLRSKFPEGVRLVSWGGKKFLQAIPERMMDRWTWCPTLKGLGLYSFGAGDAALDIQARINDAANTVHAYIDKMAFGTIIVDGSVISPESWSGKALVPGNATFVDRSDEDGGTNRTPLSDLMFQPQFHIDSKIFDYEPALIQLAQVITGVQPQVFGGSDPNVQTASGQQQALHTATGRLLLYLKRIREERAARAKNSVVCSVENMDDQMRCVMDGEIDGDYETEIVLKNEVTGDFLTYPETDEGFPATYQEIQERIMTLLTDGAQSPFVGAILQDPDTLKVVSQYVLPEPIVLPGDAERARIKIILQKLWKAAPVPAMAPTGQVIMLPSIQPNPDFDDLNMCVLLAKSDLQQKWELQEQKPDGFNNVLAFLRLSAQMMAQAAAKMQMAAQAAGTPDDAKQKVLGGAQQRKQLPSPNGAPGPQ